MQKSFGGLVTPVITTQAPNDHQRGYLYSRGFNYLPALLPLTAPTYINSTLAVSQFRLSIL